MKSFVILAFIFLAGCTTTPKRETVTVDGFTFIGIPRAWSETALIVDVVKVTKGSFSERQVAFQIDPNQDTPPPLKIGVRYSITCTYGIGGDYRWFGYKIRDYHEVQ
jgi:hypothetical protein